MTPLQRIMVPRITGPNDPPCVRCGCPVFDCRLERAGDVPCCSLACAVRDDDAERRERVRLEVEARADAELTWEAARRADLWSGDPVRVQDAKARRRRRGAA